MKRFRVKRFNLSLKVGIVFYLYRLVNLETFLTRAMEG